MNHFSDTVISLTNELENEKIAYCLLGGVALSIQGVSIEQMDSVDISVQWDLFEYTYDVWRPSVVREIEKNRETGSYAIMKNGVCINVVCHYNTVVETDPHRIRVDWNGHVVWVKSLYFYKRYETGIESSYTKEINHFLQRLQQENSDVNSDAWNQNTYDAWVFRHGPPEQAAAKIRRNPVSRLHPLFEYMGNVDGKRIINLLGSHGSKAVALALLGANVTVVDISAENAAYAGELAKAAGVDIRYVVSDVLNMPKHELSGDYDLVLMELGILHYFVDLQPLVRVVMGLLREGGRLLLHDFHPVSTKLITSKGKKHKVTDNYFDPSIQETNVAYAKYGTDESPAKQVRLRKWTLGEIVTAVAQEGLVIRLLSEEPNHKIDDIGIPKTFTLIAEKLAVRE